MLQKTDLLVHLIEQQDLQRMLVFTRTKHRAERVAQGARARIGIRCAVIHGNRTQSQRQHALDGFKNGKVRVLVATDIVARGIDVDDISHVVNYDVPNNPEDYVHRIGRTARAGTSGTAITLFSPEEIEQLRDIEKMIGAVIEREDLEGFAYTERASCRTPSARRSPPSSSSARPPAAAARAVPAAVPAGAA